MYHLQLFTIAFLFEFTVEFLHLTGGPNSVSGQDILPISCQRNLTKVELGSIDCSDVVPKELAGLVSSDQVSVHRIWNRGRWIQVNGFACLKIKVTAVCRENLLGMTETSSNQELMIATESECLAHLRRYLVSAWNPQMEIKYTCRWMRTEETEKSLYRIQPVSVIYDVLRSTYQFPGDVSKSTECKSPPCLMPDMNSLWFPENQRPESCVTLPETSLFWTRSSGQNLSFSSYSLHGTTLLGSCKVSFCNVDGFLLKTGEWLSENELPAAIKASTSKYRPCGEGDKIARNIDSDIQPRHNYNKISTQIMYHSCLQVKVNVQNTDYPFYPSSLQSISPKKEGLHPGYFVFNRTLYSTLCRYQSLNRVPGVLVKKGLTLYMGQTYKDKHDIVYTGPHLVYKNITIGPNGLVWDRNNNLVTNHTFEQSLLQNVDLEPHYIESSRSLTLTPFSPYNHTELTHFDVLTDIMKIETILKEHTNIKCTIVISGLLVIVCYICIKVRKIALTIRNRSTVPSENTTELKIRPNTGNTDQRIVVINENDKKFVEFLLNQD